jgi:hypothetical protein
VVAGQLTQMLSRPTAALSVGNPLPAAGGVGGDTAEDVRAGASVGTRSLGRLVSIDDYADYALGWTGVAKATAMLGQGPSGSGAGLVVTVAGPDPAPLDPAGPVIRGLAVELAQLADPNMPVSVVPAALFMIVMAGEVIHDPAMAWDAVAAEVTAALTSSFAYANRQLGQPVAVGDLAAAAHAVPAVRAFAVSALAVVPNTVTAGQLADVLPTLLATRTDELGGSISIAQAVQQWSSVPSAGLVAGQADGIAFLSASVPDTLLLQEAS